MQAILCWFRRAAAPPRPDFELLELRRRQLNTASALLLLDRESKTYQAGDSRAASG